MQTGVRCVGPLNRLRVRVGTFLKRWMPGVYIVLGSLFATSVMLGAAVTWGPHHCAGRFPMIIGCAIGSYEGLTGGMIAATAAVTAGWLAWRAVQVQIEAEETRSRADRVEVEEVLKRDVARFAEALASIWKILDGLDKSADSKVNINKIEGIIYGIEIITKSTWISTSRRMVTELGWRRRREYEELFDGLEWLGTFRRVDDFDAIKVLNVVRSLSRDFEVIEEDNGKYFKGLFRRAGKAWTLGYAIEVAAGIHAG